MCYQQTNVNKILPIIWKYMMNTNKNNWKLCMNKNILLCNFVENVLSIYMLEIYWYFHILTQDKHWSLWNKEAIWHNKKIFGDWKDLNLNLDSVTSFVTLGKLFNVSALLPCIYMGLIINIFQDCCEDWIKST